MSNDFDAGSGSEPETAVDDGTSAMLDSPLDQPMTVPEGLVLPEFEGAEQQSLIENVVEALKKRLGGGGDSSSKGSSDHDEIQADPRAPMTSGTFSPEVGPDNAGGGREGPESDTGAAVDADVAVDAMSPAQAEVAIEPQSQLEPQSQSVAASAQEPHPAQAAEVVQSSDAMSQANADAMTLQQQKEELHDLQETAQMLSNISNMRHDVNMSIIQNMR